MTTLSMYYLIGFVITFLIAYFYLTVVEKMDTDLGADFAILLIVSAFWPLTVFLIGLCIIAEYCVVVPVIKFLRYKNSRKVIEKKVNNPVIKKRRQIRKVKR